MLVIRLLAMVGLLGIYLAGWYVVCIRLLVMVGLLGIYLAGGDAVCLRIIGTLVVILELPGLILWPPWWW